MLVKALNTISLAAVVAIALVGVTGTAQSQPAELTVVTYECRFVPDAKFAKVTGVIHMSGPDDPRIALGTPCNEAFSTLLAMKFRVHRFITRSMSTGISGPPTEVLWPDDVAILMWAVKSTMIPEGPNAVRLGKFIYPGGDRSLDPIADNLKKLMEWMAKSDVGLIAVPFETLLYDEHMGPPRARAVSEIPVP